MRGWERSAPPAQRQAGAASARFLQLLVADPLRPSRGSRFARAGFRFHRLVEEPKDRRVALPGGQLVPLRPCNTEKKSTASLPAGKPGRPAGLGVEKKHPPPPAANWKRVKLGSGNYARAPAAPPSLRARTRPRTHVQKTRALCQPSAFAAAGKADVIAFPRQLGEL